MKLSRLASAIGISAIVTSPVAMAAPLYGVLGIDDGYKNTVITASGSTVSSYAGGSYFAMGANNPNGTAAMLRQGSDGGVLLGAYQNFTVIDANGNTGPHPQGWQGDTNGDGIPDGAAGAGYTGITSVANMLLPFGFFGTSTYVGTNPISFQSGQAHPTPSADVDMSSCVGNLCNFTLEISALEVYWNGSVFEQGPRPNNSGPFTLAQGTYDLSNHHYSVTWASQIKNGPFSGVNGFWHLEGTHVVPVPAAVWLFGSGLLGLVGLARRKK